MKAKIRLQSILYTKMNISKKIYSTQEKGEIFLQKGFIKKIISSNTVQQVQCAYIKLPTRHTLAYSVHIINVSKNIKSVFTQIISIKYASYT